MLKDFRLKNFPVSFFSVILGLSGFVITLQKATEIIELNKIFSTIFLYLTIIVFIAIVLFYAQKMIKYPKEIKKEFYHPIKINFFPTFSISLLLLSVALAHVNPAASKNLWILGVLIQFFFSLKIISTWIQHKKFTVEKMNPSWFIPAVGNILVPVVGIVYAPIEISWFFFSVGLFFWIILLIVFFNRIFFHDPLPEKLLPTIFILIAPPAVGFIAYFKLTKSINDFSIILYNFALFLTILMFFQFKMFKDIKYYLSWWAYSFPLASMSIATALMYHLTHSVYYQYLFNFLLLTLSILIASLFYKTIQHIFKKEICVEED